MSSLEPEIRRRLSAQLTEVAAPRPAFRAGLSGWWRCERGHSVRTTEYWTPLQSLTRALRHARLHGFNICQSAVFQDVTWHGPGHSSASP